MFESCLRNFQQPADIRQVVFVCGLLQIRVEFAWFVIKKHNNVCSCTLVVEFFVILWPLL